MTVAENTRGQFEILKKLLRRSDVSEVVNACDAGREGELIFRSVYHLAGCSKPIKRLWISSMEEAAIREGFAEPFGTGREDNAETVESRNAIITSRVLQYQ